jgi:hypothetical protein
MPGMSQKARVFTRVAILLACAVWLFFGACDLSFADWLVVSLVIAVGLWEWWDKWHEEKYATASREGIHRAKVR